MEKISIEQIRKYTDGKILIQKYGSEINRVSIDNREVDSETLFVPIIGNVHDGHKFMKGAYDAGCRSFICDKNHSFYKEDINLVEVSDTKLAFGSIAKGYRNKFDIPLVAITGSVGKTSTKDIINSVLSVKYNTIKTIGNLNNDIGVPKTLFTITSDTELAVVEMGMDHKGEIDYLSRLVSPDVAIITNIGMSHIMNFDNQDGIFEAKMEIVNGLKDNGLLIVNGDDKYLGTLRDNNHSYELITYGFDKDNDIYCSNYKIYDDYSVFTCIYDDNEYSFKLGNIAKHNIGNALIAIVLGFRYGLTYDEIKKGLIDIDFSNNRLDIIKTSKYTIINDTYNSSYDSVMSALEVLNSFKTRKVAILGDIFELGDYSLDIHKKIGNNLKCDVLIAIGDNAKYISDEALDSIESYYFLTKEDFYDKISAIFKEGDTILVKASRGMEFDKIVDELKETQ